MAEEQKITAQLLEKFPFLENKIRIGRERRIFLEAPQDKFSEVFDYAVKNLKFCILCTISGLDEGEVFGFIYHIARETGEVLNLKISVPRQNLVIKTITDYFSGAEIYEREIMDLLGVEVEGLKEGKRYPLPDNWPQGEHPLRKDWKPKSS